MSRSDAPTWKKPESEKIFWDGEKFLVAILVHSFRNGIKNGIKNTEYEYHIIRASCDTDTPVSFVHDITDEPFDEWGWEDIDWYISINHKDVAGDE